VKVEVLNQMKVLKKKQMEGQLIDNQMFMADVV
jgi:hypothetical protein